MYNDNKRTHEIASVKVRSDQASVAAAASSPAMTLGIALGLIWFFDASDATATDAWCECDKSKPM